MIKVLVIDDSAFMRQIIKKTINNYPGQEVIETLRNGQDILKKLQKYKPDVITLDVEMPGEDGLTILKKIINEYPDIPVIMLSGIDKQKNVIKALEIGAFDFIPKPSGTISLNIEDIENEITSKIEAAAESKLSNLNKNKKQQVKNEFIERDFPVIAIGSSSGGPRALKKLLIPLPANLPAAIIIVQHMPAGFTRSLAEHLNRDASIKVKEAAAGDNLKKGTALIAPGDYHLQLNDRQQIELNKKAKKWGVRPCVDYMMTSVAAVFANRVIGIILTGMGHDGAEGMQSIKNNNGYGIVESKETALVYGMPGSTIEKNAYDSILPLDQIPATIISLTKGEH